MKKILLALLTLISVISYSQTTGYFRYDSIRLMKAGGNSNLIIENATRDTLGFLYNYGNGRTRFEAIRSVPGGIKFGDDTLFVAAPVCNQFSAPIAITYIQGFDFAASEGSYNINCVPYNSDSIHFSLDTADDDFDRYDVFYADETGVHVLKGVAEELATIPSLELGQLFIAWVRIPANSLTPAISQAFIYNENIEWTGAQAGATVDFDNTSNVYIGSKAINWTNITSGDVITLTLASGTIDLSDYDALNLFIRPKQALSASARVWVRWYNDATPASSEVMIPINIASFNSYQAFGINLSSFTFQNTNVNRLRIRYTISNASTIAGFYLDNIFLESGLVLPGGPGNDVSIVSNIPAIDVQESNDNFTFSATGNSSQYIRGDGTLATFSAVTTVGAFGSQASQANGLFISGSNIYGQPVTDTEPGMTTPAMKASWDSSYYVQNLGDGLQIARAVDNATTGLRSLVFIGADTSASNDSTLIIEITAGTAQRFGFTTEDDAAAENRDFATGANQFRLHSNDGSVSTFLDFWDVGNLKIGSDNVGSEGSGGHFNFGAGLIAVNNIEASSVSSLKMLAIDTAGGANILYTTAIPAGGGAVSSVTGTANQIAASPTTGAVTLSIPSVFSAPGTITSASTLTVTSGGLTVTAGGALITAGGLTVTAGTTTLTPLNSIGLVVNSAAGVLSSYGATDHALQLGNATGQIASLGLGTAGQVLTSNGAGFDPSWGAGGSSLFPVTGTGTATGNVIGDLDGNTLSISGGNVGIGVAPTMLFQVRSGADDFLSIDATPGSETIEFKVTNATGDENISYLQNTTTNTSASFNLRADFNDGVNVATITGLADVSTGAISYSAPNGHTFTGNVLAKTSTYNSGLFSIANTDGIVKVGDFDITVNGTTVILNDNAEQIEYKADNGHTFTGSILPVSDNSTDIGSAAASFKDGYFRTTKYDGSTSGTITVEATATAGTNTITLPAATGTVALTSNMSITKGFLTDALTINGSTTIIPRYYWYDEFQGASTAIAGSAFMMELVSGTGANASVASNAASLPGATGYGYVELTTGTTATGKAMLSGGFGATTQNQMGKVDDDFYYRCEFKNVILGDLSDGTETYKVFIGFQIDNTVSNAVYFTYTHSENSGVWNCTSHNATTPETTSTATTVAADTEYDFAIEVYNQTVKFYLNGTLVATHTTQVPPAASIMYAPSARILKSAGLTARVVYIDATGLRITHENDL